MAEQTPADRIRKRYSSRKWMYVIVLIGYYAIASGLLWNIADGDINRLKGFADNMLTEIGGAAITFFIFELILERRDQERDMLRALRQMNSIANDTAITGADELREGGLLTDGTLRGSDLYRSDLKLANLDDADLEGVNLSGVSSLEMARLWRANLKGASLPLAILKDVSMTEANLEGANLEGVNARNAHMSKVNFQRADLERANLEGADLSNANFQRTRLWNANLQGANLEGADFRGAFLSQANLQGANLQDAKFDESTVLPEHDFYGEVPMWTSETDMTRYTDSEHSDFWRSDRRRSPAYRGDDDEAITDNP
jgi:uncharacterized protein YjbI with pentapeptide repeats